MVKRKPVKRRRRPDNEEADEPPEPWGTTPPQDGLVPFGNTPFYHTPDEPASPFDCNRYPSSIYCGENPWTQTPIGLEPVIVIDECNLGIELTPILGFTTLPPVQIVYRRPGEKCREKPPIEPPPFTENDEYTPIFNLTDQICLYKVVVEYTSIGYEDQYTKNGISPQVYKRPYQTFTEHTYTLCWSPIGGLKTTTILGTNKEKYDWFDELVYSPNNTDTQFSFLYARGIHGGQGGYEEAGLEQTSVESFRNRLRDNSEIYKEYLAVRNRYRLTRSRASVGGAGGFSAFDAATFFKPPKVISIDEVWCPPDRFDARNFSPPPPPKLKKRCDCPMTCCPDVTQNEELLRSLIRKVDTLSKVIGVEDYPVSLPTSLISRDEGFLGNLVPNFNQDVPSLTRFLAWYVERFDEVLGQWEIPIEIKDSDPSKPGDQPLGVKLPNMAEAIAEMFTLIFQTNLNSEVLLNFAVRTAAETVTDKQQNFITYKLLQSMAEWAGYKQKDIKLKMPSLFSLGKTRYDEILQEAEIDVACVDFDEKFGLEADLMRFREAVAILQANYKKKVDPSGDIKGQILKHLLDSFAAVNKVNPEDDEQDFEKFLKEVEDGFINTPGINNTTNPYGRPYNERPKIRDLTKLDPPTEP